MMPPSTKFQREEIIAAALDIVREAGMNGLTSRSLGARLNTSACPVFTAFGNMDELRREVVAAAKALYKEYVENGLAQTPAFKGVGTQYILFAVREPKLFQLLFMKEQPHIPDLGGVLPLIEESYDKILLSITDGYGLDNAAAEKLYRHLWIYTHGIASLCATKMCRFTGEEISIMMTEVCTGLLSKIREEQEK